MEESIVWTRFDDWAYLDAPQAQPKKSDEHIPDNNWPTNFLRHHAVAYVMDELGCSRNRAKNIVRGSLTRIGGVEHFCTSNGTYIHRQMFERYVANLQRCEEREAEFQEREGEPRSRVPTRTRAKLPD